MQHGGGDHRSIGGLTGQIVTVNDNFASIAMSVGGDLVNVTIGSGQLETSSIQPKPSMVLKVKKADLLIRLGMSQDAWVDGLIQAAIVILHTNF